VGQVDAAQISSMRLIGDVFGVMPEFDEPSRERGG
jgi:hypothetical protein